MQNNDVKTRDQLRAMMQKSIRENDTEGFYDAFDQMLRCIEQDVKQEYEQKMDELKAEHDRQVLSSRGVRQLTSEERKYYQKFAQAALSKNPQQAVANLDVVMPKTTIDAVFDELQTAHPLLSIINFRPSGGAAKVIINTNGYEEAQWGELCDEIVKELTSGFKKIDTMLLKLSAFIPVCKAMLELGPEWLDNYVRQVLYEALSNGLEAGIVDGDGNEKPIGMTRQVGAGVTVTDGVYPQKAKIEVNDLSPATIGNLVSIMAADPNGKPRHVRDVIFVVNPQDYFQKIMPATTLMAPDGSYRNDVLPYPMRVVQSPALKRGEAVMGIAYRYLALAGTSPEGRIEYSDHYRFLEDERVYLIKAYANGMPMDNNAFLFLDVSGLKPASWKVTLSEEGAPSNNAALSSLSLGSLSLTPDFKSDTTTYTTSTSNATNTITAVPADASAQISVKVGDKEIDNGSAATWETGENTVNITVTAADGKTAKTYTITVTKA